MMAWLYYPHSFLRRHMVTVERLIVAAGLSAVTYLLMHNLPAYPPYWELALTVIVFGVTLWSPMVGYLLASLAMAYALYSVSLYLAVLFLVIAVVGVRLFANNLGGVLLVLFTPWLGPWYLMWVTPLLGGLWWGAAGGAVMGGLAALWGQVAASMCGLSPDWLARLGTAPGAVPLIERFAQADSLQTLLLILQPLTPDSTTLLYYLLQVVLWTVVGGVLGARIERPSAFLQHRQPRGALLMMALGAAALVVGHLALAAWLGVYNLQILGSLLEALTLAFMLTVLAVSVLELLRNWLEHPLPAPRPRRRSLRRPTVSSGGPPGANDTPVQPAPTSTDEKDSDDLIKLELD